MQHRGLAQRPATGFAAAAHCAQVKRELDSLGWQRLASVDASFRRLQLSAQDAAGRTHLLTVQLDAQVTAAGT